MPKNEKIIYFDNAALAPLLPEIAQNPAVQRHTQGSTGGLHAHSRQSATNVWEAQKRIAATLNCPPGHIVFAYNALQIAQNALHQAVLNQNIRHVVLGQFAPPEIVAFLSDFSRKRLLKIHFVRSTASALPDLEHLQALLHQLPSALLFFQHVHPFLGSLLPLKKISKLSRAHSALFFADMAHTPAFYAPNLSTIEIDLALFSAHRFHALPGLDFFYSPHTRFSAAAPCGEIEPAAAEIVALALHEAQNAIPQSQEHTQKLKMKLFEGIKQISDKAFALLDPQKSACHILSMVFPDFRHSDMLAEKLDIKGVALSYLPSEILKNKAIAPETAALRFSLSRFSTASEVKKCLCTLKEVLAAEKDFP